MRLYHQGHSALYWLETNKKSVHIRAGEMVGGQWPSDRLQAPILLRFLGSCQQKSTHQMGMLAHTFDHRMREAGAGEFLLV